MKCAVLVEDYHSGILQAMKIALDFDGVVTDCGALKSEGAKKLFGIDVSPEKFKKEIVVGNGFLTLSEYRLVQKSIYNDLEFGLQMKAVEGLFDGISMLELNHELQIITSRDEESVLIAKAWLEKHKIHIPIVGVGQGVSKVTAARGFDVFIDDDLEKLIELQGVVPHLFLFSWPYNSQEFLPDQIKRVIGWNHFVKLVESI